MLKKQRVKSEKTLNELASEFGMHPVQIAQWKRQLQDARAGVFEGSASGRREREQEQLVEQLNQEIGQMQVEVDWPRNKGIARVSNTGNSGC